MTLPFSSSRSSAGCRLKPGMVIPVLVTRFSKSMKSAIRRSGEKSCGHPKPERAPRRPSLRRDQGRLGKLKPPWLASRRPEDSPPSPFYMPERSPTHMRESKRLALLVVLLAESAGASCAGLGPNTTGPNNPSNINWDFEDSTLAGWQADGDAFTGGAQPHPNSGFSAARPIIGGSYYRGTRDIGAHHKFLIATGDAHVGTLSSAEFTLETNHTFVSALIGGSNDSNVFFAVQSGPTIGMPSTPPPRRCPARSTVTI